MQINANSAAKLGVYRKISKEENKMIFAVNKLKENNFNHEIKSMKPVSVQATVFYVCG